MLKTLSLFIKPFEHDNLPCVIQFLFMRIPRLGQILPIVFSICGSVLGTASAQEDGFKSIFDGQSLNGWETPDPSYWTVEDGAIVGRITREHPCTVNQYLVWSGGELADFELKLQSQLKGEGGINNGFQFRSRLLPDHDICGYQMDNNLQTPWLVRLYEEFGRHTLAMRGERTVFDAKGGRETSKLDDVKGAWFRLEEWHEYHLKCVGPRITLRVNEQLAAEVEDNDPRRQAFQGVLGLQLHSGPPTVVQFKNIRLKILKPASKTAPAPLQDWQKDRRMILAKAAAWWPLDSGGHGTTPLLRHVPGWEHFELNRRTDGAGATPDARVVLLDGAYFTAGTNLQFTGEQITVLLRARDPGGKWNAGLFNKRGGKERVNFNLFSADVQGPSIGFEVQTAEGLVTVQFAVSQIKATAWQDLIGRYDGKSIALFCDGRLMNSKPCRGVLLGNEEPLFIGSESEDGKIVRHFHGELEEAAIWSSALTDQEIQLISRHQ